MSKVSDDDIRAALFAAKCTSDDRTFVSAATQKVISVFRALEAGSSIHEAGPVKTLRKTYETEVGGDRGSMHDGVEAAAKVQEAYDILCSGNPPHSARESNARRALRVALDRDASEIAHSMHSARRIFAHPNPISKEVTIKALEWEQGEGNYDGQEVWSAGDPWLFWIVKNPDSPNYVWCETLNLEGFVPASPVRGSYPTLAEAKAAAQADFDARIRSCLSHTAGEIEAGGEVERLKTLSANLVIQAQGHAMEARTANSTIYEIYQVLSGATGEPGNWHGAEPAREYVAKTDKRIAELEAELTDARATADDFCKENVRLTDALVAANFSSQPGSGE